MKPALICHFAFLLPDPAIDPRDIFVPVAVASLMLVAVLCFRPPQKVKRFLVGLVAVLLLYPMVVVPSLFAPRMSVGFFALVAFPLVLIAYTAAWRRKLVSILAVTGIVVLAASPIDFAVDFHAEKKGVYLVPVGYSIGGGFQGSFYSLGCLPPPSSVYSASHVCVLSL
jgi:hypothetical protein